MSLRNYNPVCPHASAAKWCSNECSDEQVACTIACEHNTQCVTQCARQFATCESRCPCHEGCYEGCPCDYKSKYCEKPVPGDDTIEVLIIKPDLNATPKAQIVLTWPINDDGTMGRESHTTFEMDFPSTFQHRREMCHFELRGQLYMVGGSDDNQSALKLRTKEGLGPE